MWFLRKAHEVNKTSNYERQQEPDKNKTIETSHRLMVKATLQHAQLYLCVTQIYKTTTKDFSGLKMGVDGDTFVTIVLNDIVICIW